MKLNLNFWLKLSVFNLSLVALLGVLMRYKIGFEFPLFEQKYIQHAHSHFAFSAWISQTLFVLIVNYLSRHMAVRRLYKRLLIANTLVAYGMLISFFIQGYGHLSITFTVLSLMIDFLFAYAFFIDLHKLKNPANKWFRAALFFNVFSSLGTFSLAYMMATHHIQQNYYLSSVYFYLHFQYNAWFFFACVGLLVEYLHRKKPENRLSTIVFKIFLGSVIPAYMLSILWLKLPLYLYIILWIASIAQLVAWTQLLRWAYQSIKTLALSVVTQKILFLLACVGSIKFLLQLTSTIPAISHLAFGFRPIVIAYLHLVLLCLISLFLINYINGFLNAEDSKNRRLALSLFVIGIFINEIMLATQGAAALLYILVPAINEILFVNSLLILGSLLAYLKYFPKSTLP